MSQEFKKYPDDQGSYRDVKRADDGLLEAVHDEYYLNEPHITQPADHNGGTMESPLVQSDTNLLLNVNYSNYKRPSKSAASTPALPNSADDFIYDSDEEMPTIYQYAKAGNQMNSEQEISLQHYTKQKQYRERRKKKKGNTDIDFEGILTLIGGCSRWQMLMYTLISLQQIPHAMFNLSVVYMMYIPDHWCEVDGFRPDDFANQTYGPRDFTWEQFRDSGIMFPMKEHKKHETIHHDKCNAYVRDWINYTDYTFDELKALQPVSNYTRCKSFGYDTSVMERTITTQFNLVCDQNWSRAHAHLSYCIGYLIGCFVGGFISDRYGRKFTIIVCGIVSLLFGWAMGNAKNFPLFLTMRLMLAISNEAADLAAYVFCMEITGIRYRPMVGSLMHAPWALGYSLLALMAFQLKDWQPINTIIFLSHMAIIFLLAWKLDESPRWLIIKEKGLEAEKIIRKASEMNGNRLPGDLELIRHTEVKKWEEEHKENPTLSLFKNKALLQRNGLVCIAWAATALVYYGLVIALSDQSSPGRTIFAGNFFLNNAVGGAIELPTLLVCVYLLRAGRKPSLMISLVGASLTLLAGLAAVHFEFTTTSLTFMLLGKAFIQAAFNILYIFTSELYPTVVRNSAIGMSSLFARIGSGASGYIAILSDVTLPVVPMAIFAILSLLAGIMVFWLPETKDTPLPDTIWDAVRLEELAKEYAEKPLNTIMEEDEEDEDEEK